MEAVKVAPDAPDVLILASPFVKVKLNHLCNMMLAKVEQGVLIKGLTS